jgi:hypothetical protein
MRWRADHPFEWVLPGQGRVELPADKMRAEVLKLAESMRSGNR